MAIWYDLAGEIFEISLKFLLKYQFDLVKFFYTHVHIQSCHVFQVRWWFGAYQISVNTPFLDCSHQIWERPVSTGVLGTKDQGQVYYTVEE